MKRKNVKKFQFLIVTHVSALTVGVIGATGAELLSLKFSMATLFSTTCMAIIFLQMNRPTKYWALVRIRRQRDKAMQKAKDLESQRIIVQNISNMNIFGDNNGTIYGDNATHNEAHYHYAEEQKSAGEFNGINPYVNLLKDLISPVIDGKDWKTILCPYKAAIIEGVLPQWPHKVFVKQIGIDVPSSTYSEWINHDKYKFSELEPYSDRFKALKVEIDSPK